MRSLLPKFPSLFLRFKSHASNPNPNFSLKPPLLFSVNLSTPRHLRQCLAHAFAAGVLGSTHLHLWNSLLHSLSRSPNLDVAVPLFHLLRAADLPVDDYTFTAVLKALASLALLPEGENIHSLSLKLGFERHTFVLNSLIHMYFACGFNTSARLVFDSADDSTRDVVSWNSLISGYLQSGMCREGLMVFRSMVSKSIAMDAVTPVSALIGCGKIGAIGPGRQIHNLIVLYGFDLNCYLGSSLVNMYARCGYVEDARKLFDRIPEKNVVCWTSIISGYVQSGQFKESIELFRNMQIEGVRADDPTLASVLSSCAELGALAQGRYIHKYCDVNNIGKLLSVKNALIDMYSKCGDIQRALQVFQGIVQRDVISWTVMISGLAINGYSQEALDLFSRMELSDGIMPNEITFLGVLTACNHGGLVDKGYHYFRQMVDHYGLIPQIEHYGSMVDLLGRANLLEKAYEFIMKMPIRPDVVIWRSLLFACRANGNVDMAEYAAERIVELEPRKCGVHVLLSNVYAVSSRWNDVKRVRGAMLDWNIQKLPGFSSIELNGVVHEFLATDKSHHDSGIIYELLWMVNRHILSEAYNESCYLI
ncbi:pentatricopeptide repeat-containing protein At1g08070, chloroplastic-like [Zingiber officinale]|uniref:pentatricopeptide repeat-containing protein At1g08070, chloroplastic-like n=1 Tax=Zingiber officinale TaxID=94328 RepID=UPI001C4AF103|nr:pentatricopeptide repeat-containing protein At1g08070, chloroplastic-like [Zingiber officinale]